MYSGDNHLIVKTKDNRLFGCGYNNKGQLGLGKNRKEIPVFEEIVLPAKSLIHSVITRYDYTFVVCENNEIWGFGNAEYQLGETEGSCHYLPQRLTLLDELNSTNTMVKNCF